MASDEHQHSQPLCHSPLNGLIPPTLLLPLQICKSRNSGFAPHPPQLSPPPTSPSSSQPTNHHPLYLHCLPQLQKVLRLILLAGQDRAEWMVGGSGDLDYSGLRVQWLCTPLHRKAKAQEGRLSNSEKKGMCPIGNSRGVAARVWMTSIGFRRGIGHPLVSITWVRHCWRREDVDRDIEVVLDEKGQRWVSWEQVRDRTWTGSDHNKEYQRWESCYGLWACQALLLLLSLDACRSSMQEGQGCGGGCVRMVAVTSGHE